MKRHTTVPTLGVRFHGVRGSIPAPGPRTVRYGGNTPCVEIRAGDTRLIFDAGTGIRKVGETLVRTWGERDGDRVVDVFLTHYHWDHIHGLPFFAPLFEKGATVKVYGPESASGRRGAAEIALAQFAADHFPAGPTALVATVISRDGEASWRVGGLAVDALRVPHNGPALAYRVRVAGGGPSVAYIPDCELAGTPVGASAPASYDALVSFLQGVDVLIHDAMYNEDEHAVRRGWGHSTPGQAIDLAIAAGVSSLRLFHHAPSRDDDALTALVASAAASPLARTAGLHVAAAAEGEDVFIES